MGQDFMVGLTGSFIAATIGALGSFFMQIWSEKKKRKEAEIREFTQRVSSSLAETATRVGGQIAIELDSVVAEYVSTAATGLAGLNPDATRTAIENQIKEVQSQIVQITHRLPNEADIRNILIKLALLEKTIENITTSLTNLEGKILTKWDVVWIVFLTVGALGGILTILKAVAAN